MDEINELKNEIATLKQRQAALLGDIWLDGWFIFRKEKEKVPFYYWFFDNNLIREIYLAHMEGGMVRCMFRAEEVSGVFDMAGGIKPQCGFFVKDDFSVHAYAAYDVSANWWKHYDDATPIGKMPRQMRLFYFDYFSAQANIKLCGDGLSSE